MSSSSEVIDLTAGQDGETIIARTMQCWHCKGSSLLKILQKEVDIWESGRHIQDAFPMLTPDQRELLLTGIHPECWEAMGEE